MVKGPEDEIPLWLDDEGAPMSCLEKIKVLNENYAELRQIAQDALEDGVLMGCGEEQMRRAFHQLVDDLVNPYPEKK
ncbi:MAG: hypothetical protein BWY57_00433 [Betaproteobacteria bacterium ADurb.Bin341]|nr:MAG: hypothetical protein BWY57_00433 [Betaproteobacteria bacterium ADurb.Bin341]